MQRFRYLIKAPRKPEMERKRRQRINDCLFQIKQLIPEAKELEVSLGFSKRVSVNFVDRGDYYAHAALKQLPMCMFSGGLYVQNDIQTEKFWTCLCCFYFLVDQKRLQARKSGNSRDHS